LKDVSLSTIRPEYSIKAEDVLTIVLCIAESSQCKQGIRKLGCITSSYVLDEPYTQLEYLIVASVVFDAYLPSVTRERLNEVGCTATMAEP
jgi:hypothetical protein